MRTALSVLLVCAFPVLSGCMMSAAQHADSLPQSRDRSLTVGTVQARISRGMSAAEVAEVLGSPNIVTKDSGGDETWVYDKIATEASYSTDQGSSVGLGGAGGGTSTLLLGGLFGSYSRAAGASATTQRTLTVVIKFDRLSKVKDFSYHATKF